MSHSFRPTWQLPPGVSRGTWDYVTDSSIAVDYDAFHGEHPLMKLDVEYVRARLSKPPSKKSDRPILMDLGCGTGRAILPWRERGWQTIGVDLSRDMLDETSSKAGGVDEKTALVHANIAQLEGFRDSIADAVICLYSSFGMVRGQVHRRAMLSHVHRMLKPGGCLIVHVHNRGNWLTFPHGLKLWISSLWQSITDRRSEFGDRIYPYRGLPSMFLHIFSRRELLNDLQSVGFTIESCRPLNSTSSDWLSSDRFLPTIRAGGFIATATK